jgi:hypothetical protein
MRYWIIATVSATDPDSNAVSHFDDCTTIVDPIYRQIQRFPDWLYLWYRREANVRWIEQYAFVEVDGACTTNPYTLNFL